MYQYIVWNALNIWKPKSENVFQMFFNINIIYIKKKNPQKIALLSMLTPFA